MGQQRLRRNMRVIELPAPYNTVLSVYLVDGIIFTTRGHTQFFLLFVLRVLRKCGSIQTPRRGSVYTVPAIREFVEENRPFVCPQCRSASSQKYNGVNPYGRVVVGCMSCEWSQRFNVDGGETLPELCPECNTEMLFNSVESEYVCVYCG